MAAKVVGGGSTINGMFFDRASKGDYDIWEELGGKGWGWKDLFPYFKKSETFTPPTEPIQQQFGITYDMAAHGTSGPIHSSYPTFLNDVLKNWFRAFSEIGVHIPQEMGGGSALGMFWVPSAIDPVTRTRSYARPQYYDPVVTRPNYHLLADQTVTKILFDGKKAKGVQFSSAPGAEAKSVYAKRDIILAAGAIGSPKLLQLSGIGPKKLLNGLGIKAVQYLEGVGSNFQDHGGSIFGFNFANLTVRTPDPEADLAQYLANRTGPLSTFGGGPAAAFIPVANFSSRAGEFSNQILALAPTDHVRPGLDSTVLAGIKKQREIIARLFKGHDTAAEEILTSGAGGLVFALHRPLSRGYVEINTTDPFAYPVIDYRTFENPIDRQVVMDGIRHALGTLNTTAMAPLGGNDVDWSLVYDDARLAAAVDAAAYPSSGHPSSTCPMMKRELGGVVDSKLRVYGVDNLRIIDASIMPLIPATHLSATMYAIGEKAADVIRG